MFTHKSFLVFIGNYTLQKSKHQYDNNKLKRYKYLYNLYISIINYFQCILPLLRK